MAAKRCKGCIFWQVFHGDVKNPVMRRLLSQEDAPRTRQHACTLRLLTVLGKDGEEPTQRPSFDPKDPPGPRYGQRIGPHGVCDHHTAKRLPYRTPRPVIADLAEQQLSAGMVPSPMEHQSAEQPAEVELRAVALV